MNSTVLYLEKIIPFYSGLLSLVITMLFFWNILHALLSAVFLFILAILSDQ